MKKKNIRQKGAASVRGLFAPIALLVLSAFVLLAFRKEEFDGQALVAGGVLLVLLYGSYRMFCGVYPECDRHLLIIVDLLIAVGIIVQYRIAPDTALKQLLSIGIGIVAMFVAALLFSDTERLKSRALCYLLMAGSVGLLALPLVFGDEQYGAKNWIDLGFFSLQPSELIKVVLVFVLASFLAEKTRLRDPVAARGLFSGAFGAADAGARPGRGAHFLWRDHCRVLRRHRQQAGGGGRHCGQRRGGVFVLCALSSRESARSGLAEPLGRLL